MNKRQTEAAMKRYMKKRKKEGMTEEQLKSWKRGWYSVGRQLNSK